MLVVVDVRSVPVIYTGINIFDDDDDDDDGTSLTQVWNRNFLHDTNNQIVEMRLRFMFSFVIGFLCSPNIVIRVRPVGLGLRNLCRLTRDGRERRKKNDNL